MSDRESLLCVEMHGKMAYRVEQILNVLAGQERPIDDAHAHKVAECAHHLSSFRRGIGRNRQIPNHKTWFYMRRWQRDTILAALLVWQNDHSRVRRKGTKAWVKLETITQERWPLNEVEWGRKSYLVANAIYMFAAAKEAPIN